LLLEDGKEGRNKEEEKRCKKYLLLNHMASHPKETALLTTTNARYLIKQNE
jgi:hypothetical protein